MIKQQENTLFFSSNMWPISDFFFFLWQTDRPNCNIFTPEKFPICSTSTCGTKSNMYPTVRKATAVWMVPSHLIWLLHHNSATEEARCGKSGRKQCLKIITSVCRWSPQFPPLLALTAHPNTLLCRSCSQCTTKRPLVVFIWLTFFLLF